MKAGFVLCMALAGCASVPQESVAPKIEKIYVPVAQEVKRELPAVPAWAMDALPIGAPIDEQVTALLADRQQRIGYEIKLLGACK